MWKYLSNVSKPVKKKGKTDEEKIRDDREYDQTKRKRTFQNQWTQSFPWLRYDHHLDKMFCINCEGFTGSDKDSPFVAGSTNFKIDSVKKHEISKDHIHATAVARVKTETPGSSPASKALTSLNVKQFARLCHLLRTAHGLAKHGRPFKDFSWLCDLDEQKGIDIGTSYRNDKYCRIFCSCIAELERQKLEKLTQSAKFLSIMCDEATDSAVLEQLTVFVHFSIAGKIQTIFVSINCLGQANASTIFDSLLFTANNVLKLDANSLYKKLVGFTADGAAVMQGCRNGVSALLKMHQPNIITVHCMAHRLELSFKTAVKTIPLFQNIEQFLLNLYLFYHSSPKNRSELKSLCEVNAIEPKIVTRVSGTRWVSHMKRAFDNFWVLFPALFFHMENIIAVSASTRKSKAKNFIQKLQSFHFIRAALQLNDVVLIMAKLSLTLQEKGINLPQSQLSLRTMQKNLLKLATEEGPNERLLSKVEPLTFKNVLLKNDSEIHCSKKHDLIHTIISDIEKRFPYNQLSEIENSVKLVNFNLWPKQLEKDDKFGFQEIIAIITIHKFILESNGVDLKEVENEWTSLLETIYASGKKLNSLTWEIVNDDFSSGHENILSLLDFLLSIPSTSVECERSFSLMKKIKCDWRNSLQSDTLTDLMRIALYTPSVKVFDPELAVHYFIESGQRSRRVNTMPYGKRKYEDITADDLSTDSSSNSDEEDQEAGPSKK